jgi:phosphohistidine phosphatase
MKTLYVLRHGQAANESESGSDFERVLTARGEGEALRAAHYLAKLPRPPTLVLSSSALRAKATAELCQNASLTAPELMTFEQLYLAEPAVCLATLAQAAGPHAAVLLVGHNPGLEALIYGLCERSEHLATASLAEMALSIESWAQLSAGGRGLGRLVGVFRA